MNKVNRKIKRKIKENENYIFLNIKYITYFSYYKQLYYK